MFFYTGLITNQDRVYEIDFLSQLDALKHSCILGHDDNTSFLTTFLGSSDEFLEGFHLNDAFEDFY